MRKIFLMCLLLSPVCFAMESYQPAGQELHGGDIAVSIFMGIANKTLSCLEKSKTLVLDQYFLDELQYEINRVKVYSVDKTLLNGNEVDAINYPDSQNPEIRLNRSRWMESSLTDTHRARLVLHEFLSLLGYNDTNYEISYPLIEQFKQCIGEQK